MHYAPSRGGSPCRLCIVRRNCIDGVKLVVNDVKSCRGGQGRRKGEGSQNVSLIR